MSIAALAMALCAAAIAMMSHDTDERRPQTPDAKGASTGLIYLLPICLTLSLGGTFRNAWAGPYLSDIFSADQRLSGIALTIVSFAGIVTSFAIPVTVSRVPARSVIICVMALATLGTAALAVAPGSSFVAAVALISLLYSIGNLHPLVMAEAQELMPSARRGVLLGFLNTLVFFGVAISSSLFGWVAQKSSVPSTTFQIILVVTAISLGIGLAAYRLRPRKPMSKPHPRSNGNCTAASERGATPVNRTPLH
jgi:predicted MFS family arabinose efflux permease